jgi:hypothetical protein
MIIQQSPKWPLNQPIHTEQRVNIAFNMLMVTGYMAVSFFTVKNELGRTVKTYGAIQISQKRKF